MFDLRPEAGKCLNCPNAKCMEACPLNVRIPEINRLAREDKIDEAFDVAYDDNSLGLICGIVCPHEKQCEGSCIKGMIDEPISIGKVEEAVWRWKMSRGMVGEFLSNDNCKIKVAIIGGGPAGISCASYLLKSDVSVTIYEKEDSLGGILQYGIPDFRLNKDDVNNAIKFALYYKSKGYLDIKYNHVLINSRSTSEDDKKCYVTLKELEKEYDYVFIAVGAESSKSLSLIDDSRVLSANNYLRDKIDLRDKRVAVIGGGNVAIDSARLAKKSGANTTIIYRRQREDMPANKSEVNEAFEENINFVFKTKVIGIDSNEESLLLHLDSGEQFECDYLIEAIGSEINKNCFDDEIEFNEDGYIKVDDNFKIKNRNVYVGGDLINSKSTVAFAVYTGKTVAKNILLP